MTQKNTHQMLKNVRNLKVTYLKSNKINVNKVSYLFQLSSLFHFFFTTFQHFYFGKQTVHNPEIYQSDLTVFIGSRYKLKNLKNLVNTIVQGSMLKKPEISGFSDTTFKFQAIPGFPGPVATLRFQSVLSVQHMCC